jgi:hypothetical protein
MTTFRLFPSVFGVIFVAESPDKTALAALVLATQYHPLPVFIGAGWALTVQSVVAVVAGGVLSMLPARECTSGPLVVFHSGAPNRQRGASLSCPAARSVAAPIDTGIAGRWIRVGLCSAP